MTEFYKRDDKGEYVKATESDIDELFREKSEKIVAARLSSTREKERAKIREEIAEEVRKDTTEAIRNEVKAELEPAYKKKLAESEQRANELDIKFRRKSIAAEYGFKPETEEFLGDGSDKEMRAKADKLKESFSTSNNGKSVEKSSNSDVSEIQKETGIRVTI